MTKLVVALLVLSSMVMAMLLFLIVVFSAALLVFSKGAKRVEDKVGLLMKPEKSTR